MARFNEQTERNAAIIAAVEGGRTFADVGRQYNLNRTRIKQICARAKVKSPQTYRFMTEKEKTAIRVMHAKGIPHNHIGLGINRSGTAVRDFLKREGLHLTDSLQPLWTEAEDKTILVGYYELGSRKVALALKRTRNEVIGRADRLRKMGLLQAPKERF
jgi:hypothetical protein